MINRKTLAKNPKVMLAGSVNSSLVTLKRMIKHDLNVTGVLGLRPEYAKNVSGYQNLEEISVRNGLPYVGFKNINDAEVAAFIRRDPPDLLFVVGLSQMVQQEVLNITAYGCIGFHPTCLPKGRGRGAVAWLILGKAEGAATFFLLDEGMDSGPILVQEPFAVTKEDYASDVIVKICAAIETALDRLFPLLKKGVAKFDPQNDELATYLGRRRPEDGYIDWNRSAEDIHTLIRASARPLPGAFTYVGGTKMVIERAAILENCNWIGVPGRIVMKNSSGIVVQAGQGHVLVQEFTGVRGHELSVGTSLGIDFPHQFEIITKLLRTST